MKPCAGSVECGVHICWHQEGSGGEAGSSIVCSVSSGWDLHRRTQSRRNSDDADH